MSTNVSPDCKYTKEHEWIRVEGNEATVGITDYAQIELGDVVFVDLPEVGAEITKGSTFSSVESVKAVSDIYAPVDGKVTVVNTQLNDSPENINQEPHQSGWIIKMELSDVGQLNDLMDAQAYEKFIAEISK